MTRFPKYKEPFKLNVGSGSNPMKGFINIDNRDLGDNMVWDVRVGLPFPDNSAEKIFSSHFLEHLNDEDSIKFIGECLRVLKPKCQLQVVVPQVTSPWAFYPGHLSFWNGSRVSALERLEHPLPEFALLQNLTEEHELFFTLIKK